MRSDRDLEKQVERQARRMKRAEREGSTLLRHTVYIGTLGLLLVLPVVGGAYLGRWLDGLESGYSTRWTVAMIVLGLIIGATNAYLFIRR
jgi:ATP synthase protein I